MGYSLAQPTSPETPHVLSTSWVLTRSGFTLRAKVRVPVLGGI